MPEARPIGAGLFVVEAAGPRLLAARCPACRQPHFPAQETCPYCATDGCSELRLGPAARLYLYTAVHTRPAGYRGPVPYGFGVVELEGGLRVVTRLTEARLDRLRPGLSMQLVVEPLFTDDAGHAVLSYAFRPDEP
jgi:uncharacterized OB-fold protein